MIAFSQRLLPALQLTRMALVFTAVADILCSAMLQARRLAGPDESIALWFDTGRVIALIVISIGLYGYGMSLNDIIDRRRDRELAAQRPLPSGRIGIFAAHIICVLLGLSAVLAGLYYMQRAPAGQMSFLLLLWTGLLITGYDFAGKYLVAPGLLMLGLIRFFHAGIAAPALPLLWHPLLLMNHVTIVSAVAYAWEQKRPVLTRLHVWLLAGGLVVMNGVAIAAVLWRRGAEGAREALWIEPGLLLPGAAVVLFVAIAWLSRRRLEGVREAGGRLMLMGLLWLIVYDAAFAWAYVGLSAAGVLLLLLPVAAISVLAMRWWEQVRALAQPPQFRRAKL